MQGMQGNLGLQRLLLILVALQSLSCVHAQEVTYDVSIAADNAQELEEAIPVVTAERTNTSATVQRFTVNSAATIGGPGFADVEPIFSSISPDQFTSSLANRTSLIEENITTSFTRGDDMLDINVTADTSNATLVEQFSRDFGDGNPVFQAAAATIGQSTGISSNQTVGEQAALETLEEFGITVNRTEPNVTARVVQSNTTADNISTEELENTIAMQLNEEGEILLMILHILISLNPKQM